MSKFDGVVIVDDLPELRRGTRVLQRPIDDVECHEAKREKDQEGKVKVQNPLLKLLRLLIRPAM